MCKQSKMRSKSINAGLARPFQFKAAMDVKYINPFIAGTVEVLKTMAFVNPIAGKPYVKKSDDAHGDVSGIIGITGDAIGSLAISFSNACICHIAGNMLGETIDELTRDVLDAVGEITNMISGVARTKMEKEGMSVYAAIPSVVYGGDHTINHILKNPSIVIPFSTARGSFVIDVCIRKTKLMEKASNAYGVRNIKTLTEDPGANRPKATGGVANPTPSTIENGYSSEMDAKTSKTPDRLQTDADRGQHLKNRLAELIVARDAMRRQLTEKPFLEKAKRQLYKKNIPLFDAKIKRVKLDIAALEMLEKMTPDELENPKVISHFQHYEKKK